MSYAPPGVAEGIVVLCLAHIHDPPELLTVCSTASGGNDNLRIGVLLDSSFAPIGARTHAVSCQFFGVRHAGFLVSLHSGLPLRFLLSVFFSTALYEDSELGELFSYLFEDLEDFVHIRMACQRKIIA